MEDDNDGGGRQFIGVRFFQAPGRGGKLKKILWNKFESLLWMSGVLQGSVQGHHIAGHDVKLMFFE